jgi:hypothetical protein
MGIVCSMLKNSLLVNRYLASSGALQPKKKLETDSDTDYVNEEELPNANAEGTEHEELIQELTTGVIQEMGSEHPITYDIYNLCELSENLKLPKFAISVLAAKWNLMSGHETRHEIQRPQTEPQQQFYSGHCMFPRKLLWTTVAVLCLFSLVSSVTTTTALSGN